MKPVVMWERVGAAGMEHLTLTAQAGLTLANGLVIGLEADQPFRVTYAIEFDQAGYVRRVVGEGTRRLEFTRADTRQWMDADGQPAADYDGCTSVDIVQTPFTNTLAIQQLRLGVGESGDVDVLYLDLVEGSAARDRQRYTCLEQSPDGDGSVYRFEQLTTGFTAILPFDNDGLILNYPELFRRLYPKVSENP